MSSILKSLAIEIAEDWCLAWCKKDIDRIMSHYADDIMFYSPTISKRWPPGYTFLKGKDDLRKHFSMGLQQMPDIHFTLNNVLMGTDGFIILYKRETGLTVADVVVVDKNNLAVVVKAYYC